MDCAEAELGDTPEVHASLKRMGLVDERGASLVPLTGGVSSRILLVETDVAQFCYKQALPKLNVKDDWYAPVGRNRSEVAWLRMANRVLHGIAPSVLAVDDEAMAFAMEYFAIDEHPIWKAELQQGSETAAPAAAAGRVLATLHSATARRADIASSFANHDDFHALRIEPFFLAVARRHTELGERITDTAKRTDDARLALVHGDYSPKNILIGGKHGVVILDAECATFGDPAFDYAFCLTHLLLKARGYPSYFKNIVAATYAFKEAYRLGIAWEPIDSLEQRALSILPILLLARVDGKSPVDYLVHSDRVATREFTLGQICDPKVNNNIDLFLKDWFEMVVR